MSWFGGEQQQHTGDRATQAMFIIGRFHAAPAKVNLVNLCACRRHAVPYLLLISGKGDPQDSQSSR